MFGTQIAALLSPNGSAVLLRKQEPTQAEIIASIDAAWTRVASSGVALLQVADGSPRVVAVAPSYAGFILLAEQGVTVDWLRPLTGQPPVPGLLRAGEKLGGASIDIVAIDMPMALTKITERRVADNKISQEFGVASASTHSVNRTRPGAFGKAISDGFRKAGYSLATTSYAGARPVLIEVFPLAALVRLMALRRRPPYKVTKTTKYWKDKTREERRELLIHEWSYIISALQTRIPTMSFALPLQWSRWSELKPYEDVLFAIYVKDDLSNRVFWITTTHACNYQRREVCSQSPIERETVAERGCNRRILVSTEDRLSLHGTQAQEAFSRGVEIGPVDRPANNFQFQ